jgi:hypothetical protein
MSSTTLVTDSSLVLTSPVSSVTRSAANGRRISPVAAIFAARWRPSDLRSPPASAKPRPWAEVSAAARSAPSTLLRPWESSSEALAAPIHATERCARVSADDRRVAASRGSGRPRQLPAAHLGGHVGVREAHDQLPQSPIHERRATRLRSRFHGADVRANCYGTQSRPSPLSASSTGRGRLFEGREFMARSRGRPMPGGSRRGSSAASWS